MNQELIDMGTLRRGQKVKVMILAIDRGERHDVWYVRVQKSGTNEVYTFEVMSPRRTRFSRNIKLKRSLRGHLKVS